MKWMKKDINRIITLRKEGLTIKEIADKVKRSQHTIHQYLQQHGVHARYKKRPNSMDMIKLMNYYKVRTLKELSHRLNIPRDTLAYWSSKNPKAIKIKGGKIIRYSRSFLYNPYPLPKYPRKSEKLAELVGIILGDGHICNYKHIIKISLNVHNEKKYAQYVQNLIVSLFDVPASIVIGKRCFVVTTYRKTLVDFLVLHGLKRGNQAENGATIPNWCFEKNSYLRGCIRGLIDTDGHINQVGLQYPHRLEIGFTSKNRLIISTMRKALLSLGFIVTKAYRNGSRLSICNQKNIDKYFREIGFSNYKKQEKYKIVRGMPT